VDAALTEDELAALQELGLEARLRPRGRPLKRAGTKAEGESR
jgi:hypothetical protein